MKRFSDFAEKYNNMTGEKIKINDVLGKEIEVIDHKIGDSKQKVGTKVLMLQIKINDEKRVLFTGSNVLIDQVEKYKDEMPFLATIEKINKFYTFT